LSLTVFTQRNFVTDFIFKRSAILDEKWPFCVFEPPLFGGDLGATYDDHLRLIGKSLVEILVLIELFRYVLRLRRYTSDYRFKTGDFAAMGPVNPKF